MPDLTPQEQIDALRFELEDTRAENEYLHAIFGEAQGQAVYFKKETIRMGKEAIQFGKEAAQFYKEASRLGKEAIQLGIEVIRLNNLLVQVRQEANLADLSPELRHAIEGLQEVEVPDVSDILKPEEVSNA
jgi:predicted RNase H-like HicB family nuclease